MIMKVNKKIIFSILTSIVVIAIVVSYITKAVINFEKKKFLGRYVNIIEKSNKDNTILDDKFKDDYFNESYPKLFNIRNNIQSCNEDIYSFKESIGQKVKISSNVYSDDIFEMLLILRAIEAGNVCRNIVYYSSNEVALFTGLRDQFINYDILINHLQETINTLEFYIDELNDILSSSKNTGYQLTYANLKNETREAKQIFEKLKTNIENSYEITKNGEEKR